MFGLFGDMAPLKTIVDRVLKIMKAPLEVSGPASIPAAGGISARGSRQDNLNRWLNTQLMVNDAPSRSQVTVRRTTAERLEKHRATAKRIAGEARNAFQEGVDSAANVQLKIGGACSWTARALESNSPQVTEVS